MITLLHKQITANYEDFQNRLNYLIDKQNLISNRINKNKVNFFKIINDSSSLTDKEKTISKMINDINKSNGIKDSISMVLYFF